MQIKTASYHQSSVKIEIESGTTSFIHNKLLIGLISLNCITFCILIFINAAASYPSLGSIGKMFKIFLKQNLFSIY